MKSVERLRRGIAQARRLKASGGLAMLLVVVVLSTLLVVGVLFTATANLDHQASAHYRRAAQAELFALEGLYRAMAELYYDVWGVDEAQAFKCAEPDWPETDAIKENELADSAYYTTRSAPSPLDSSGEVKAPWSRWRRSVVPAIQAERPRNSGTYYAVFDDFRWMVGEGDAGGTRTYEGAETADLAYLEWTSPATHSGAPYHDEFLPEFTDNSDVWELGLHLNRGDLFGRCWHNDDTCEGGRWRKPPSSDAQWARMKKYWPTLGRPDERSPTEPRDFDYIETRIVGDSFYKIFRFELIDPQTKRSYAAGMDPATGDYIEPKFTHEGDATTADYTDNRGGAININQVNNNYQWELYWGWDVANDSDANDYPDPLKPGCFGMYHYNESKWIYVYNTTGDRKLGRYAVMVWPDCGCPNANMQYDIYESAATDFTATCRSTSDYFLSLDWGFTPHGGWIGGHPKSGQRVSEFTNNIVSEVVEGTDEKGQPLSAQAWYHALGTRIGDYKNAEGVFAETGGGLVSSRAELSLLIRKACFTEAANGGDPDWTHEEAAWDAHIISSLVTVNGYEYLLDHHWANDRLVLDKLGLADSELQSSVKSPYPRRSDSSFFAETADGEATRARYAKILDELRFTYGPDGVREGAHTQYHDPKSAGWMSVRAKITKATPISWLANHWFYLHYDVTNHANRPYGVSFTESGSSWSDLVTATDIYDPNINYTNTYLVAGRNDYISLSEVGKCNFPTADTIVNTYGFQEPWGWRDSYDPAGGGAPGVVYFDGSEKYFIELVKYWETNYKHTLLEMTDDRNGLAWCLYVNGYDVLQDGTTRVIGVDDRSKHGQEFLPEGKEYFTSPQTDWTPKVVPAEEAVVGSAPSADNRHPEDPAKVEWNTKDSAGQFTNVVRAGEAMGQPCGVGPLSDKYPMAVFTFDKFRLGDQSTYSGWPESYARAHAANYLVITFDRTVEVGPKPDGTTTIVLTRGGYVVDVAHLPRVSPWGYSNVFECGFDAYDPANNHYSDGYNGCWAPNFLELNIDRASPAWRGKYGYRPSTATQPAFYWHNKDLKVADYEGNETDSSGAAAGFSRASAGGWLDGLNYHTIMAYLPGGEQAPADSTNYPFTISDTMNWTGATSLVACGAQCIVCTWTGRGRIMRDWYGLLKAPTGFWAERDHLLGAYAPDPFLRTWGDLMRVTPLDRLITPGYLGGDGDSISCLGEHGFYDEVDNDVDGHIDNLTAAHISGGAPGHYFADRKVIGKMNLNEMQHPAAVWYGGVCRGTYGSQNVVVGRKPLKGYTTWFDVLKRGMQYSEQQFDQETYTPYDMIFWYENQWGDLSTDHSSCGRIAEESWSDLKETSRKLFAGNSPVYTVYATGQVLRDGEDPIAETKLRATVERTWDGKMNILEFTWMPKDIIEE